MVVLFYCVAFHILSAFASSFVSTPWRRPVAFRQLSTQRPQDEQASLEARINSISNEIHEVRRESKAIEYLLSLEESNYMQQEAVDADIVDAVEKNR